MNFVGLPKTGKFTEQIILLTGTRNVPMLIKILNREFDEEKINSSSKLFDKEHAKEYENFLLSIPETEVIKIPVTHAYKRVKLISIIEQPEFLRRIGYSPNQKQAIDEPKRYSKSTHITRNWYGD